MKTKRSATVVLALCSMTFVAHEALAFYNPQTGRWLNRDPLGDKGFHAVTAEKEQPQPDSHPCSFAANDCINRCDILGLRSEIDVAMTFSGCSPALSDNDKRKIMNQLGEGAEYLDQIISGAKKLPTTQQLTMGMAKCIRNKLRHFGVRCLSSCSPVCWGDGEGYSLPKTDLVFVCAEKMKKDPKRGTDAIATQLFHELVHSCGKFGHGDPDNPYDWGWLLSLQ